MSINKEWLINRDLSWLSFNARVLQEAQDSSVPLMERIRFLGIYSNNRDEFYRVRVATIKRMIPFGKKAKEIIGADPIKLLEKIQEIVHQQQHIFDQLYSDILVELRKEGICIVDETKLDKIQQHFVKEYFDHRVLPFLIPIMLDSAPKFPYLKDRMLYLAVKIVSRKRSKKTRYSLIEIPTDSLPRFIVLPSSNENKYVILLEDIIRYSLKNIFSIFEHDEIDSYTVKLTRDAELDIDTDISKSFMEKISRSVKQRIKGEPVRLVYDGKIPNSLLAYILQKIKLKETEYLMAGGRYHNFKDFISFPRIGRKELYYKNPPQLEHPRLSGQKSMLNAIRQKDILLAYPYNTFNHIIDILREAAIDPNVSSIYITLYRVSNHSNIINVLVNAVRNGKRVVAVVELQARFDEEINIFYANKLQEEGVEVIFGVQGLKVHSKLFLITRKASDKVVQYAHIGTGNFNENTAKTYCDHSLLTADKSITQEVEKLFGFYSNNYKTGNYKHLIVSPFNTRKKFRTLITKEIRNAQEGKSAWMILKMNSFVDNEMIEKLYEASNAGVKIQIIVRGICSLVPGIKGKSENINVISIVDRYLEHSRIYVFCNDDDNKFFLSSGDWMYRNLDHRSEVTVPVYDKDLKAELKHYLSIQLNDNVKARLLNDPEEENKYVETKGKRTRSQEEIFKWLTLKKKIQVKPNREIKIENNIPVTIKKSKRKRKLEPVDSK